MRNKREVLLIASEIIFVERSSVGRRLILRNRNASVCYLDFKVFFFLYVRDYCRGIW